MRRALGKGLSQLLGEQAEVAPTTAPIADITVNPRQPRRVFREEQLQDLAASIKAVGILQPLVVRPIAEGKYELIAGERRLRAAKIAGLAEVPVTVKSAAAQESLEMALVENVQREDITAIEAAEAYRRLAREFNMTQEQIAARVGKSRVAVSNTLRLLQLPDTIQDALAQGTISEGHARAILTADSPLRQSHLFERILRDGLTVRDTERLARGSTARKPKAKSSDMVRDIDPDLAALEGRLREYLGTPVRINPSGDGGRLVIDFFSDEDLERILEAIGLEI